MSKTTLDEILSNLYNSAWIEGSNYEENNPEGSDIPSKREIAKTAATKQALTSLIKELVEEAKPGTWVDPEDTDDLEWQGYVKGVSDFEQNLLKALGDNDGQVTE